MPYPMIECPTFGKLRDRLRSEFQCEYKSVKLIESEPAVTFFERIVEGVTLQCVVALDDDYLIIEPHMLRHICDRLQIPKERFGLTLG